MVEEVLSRHIADGEIALGSARAAALAQDLDRLRGSTTAALVGATTSPAATELLTRLLEDKVDWVMVAVQVQRRIGR